MLDGFKDMISTASGSEEAKQTEFKESIAVVESALAELANETAKLATKLAALSYQEMAADQANLIVLNAKTFIGELFQPGKTAVAAVKSSLAAIKKSIEEYKKQLARDQAKALKQGAKSHATADNRLSTSTLDDTLKKLIADAKNKPSLEFIETYDFAINKPLPSGEAAFLVRPVADRSNISENIQKDKALMQRFTQISKDNAKQGATTTSKNRNIQWFVGVGLPLKSFC